MNLSVYPALVEQIKDLSEHYGWSKRQVVTLAVRALAQLMAAHEGFAAQYDADISDLYMRLAGEMPAGFVEVPKDGVRIARAEGVPVVIIDDAWVIWADPAGNHLFAEEQGGQGRVAVVRDGEIKPIKVPTSDEVASN